jgi:UDP-N-acetylglucosamine 2-epimerase
MYDSFLFNKELAEKKSVIFSDLNLKPKSYCLATIHREENTENSGRLANLFSAFEELATVDCPFVIPLHPRTQKLLQEYRLENRLSPHVRIIAPVSYTDMIALEVRAHVILTDSGGVQKEACFAGVPCVTLRHETEWVETLQFGRNYLGGTEAATITEAFERATESTQGNHFGLYGEGKASEDVVRYITENS